MRRIMIVVVLVLVVASAVSWAQAPVRPTRTECKLWDRAYAAVFDMFAVGTVGITMPLALLLTLFARRHWALARVWLRALIAAVAAFLVSAILLVLWPLVFGWGALHLSGVDPRYSECRGVTFNPDGILWGSVGVGVPGLDLMPTMLGLLLGASLLGMFLVLFAGWVRVRAFGIRRKVERGEG